MRIIFYLWILSFLSCLTQASAFVLPTVTPANTVLRSVEVLPQAIDPISGALTAIGEFGLQPLDVIDYGAKFLSVFPPAAPMARIVSIGITAYKLYDMAHGQMPSIQDYATDKGWTISTDGNLKGQGTSPINSDITIPASCHLSSTANFTIGAQTSQYFPALPVFINFHSTNISELGTLRNSTITSMTRVSYQNGGWARNSATGWSSVAPVFPSGSYLLGSDTYYKDNHDGTYSQMNFFFIKDGTATDIVPLIGLKTLTSEEITSAVSQDYGAQTTAGTDARAMSQELTDSIKGSLKTYVETGSQVSPDEETAPKVLLDEYVKAIKEALTSNDLSNIQSGYDPATIAEVKQSQPIGSTSDKPALTEAEVQEAVKEGVKDALKDEEEAPDYSEADPEVPPKKNLTTVMGTFLNSIRNLSLLQSLTGMQITSSGSSVYCTSWGSETKCTDFAQYQSSLEMIGMMLLTFTTIGMVFYLFRG